MSEDEPQERKNEFYTSLNRVIDEIGASRELIIAGDLNSRVGRKENNNIIGPFGEDVMNDNGERLFAFCEQYGLKILNGFYQHKDIHKFTRHQDTLQQKSIIDYIITKQQTALNINDVRVFRGATYGSEYYLVNSKFCYSFLKSNKHKKEIEKKHKM